MHKTRCLIALSMLAALCAPASADDAIRPGRLIVDPPTLICGSFQWFGSGDENMNATVDVAYRKAGRGEWRSALPMYRLDQVDANLPLFAGSILDLEEDTQYEAKLTLADPDGVTGDARRVVRFRTWAEPTAPAESDDVRHVYPSDHRGEKLQPAYVTLQGALRGSKRGGRGRGDDAGPGTTLVLHAGVYKGNPTDYREINALHFTGSYNLAPRSGAAGKPMLVKAAGDGEVIIDGAGAHVLFDCVGAKHVHFEGLTIRNCGIAFQLSDKPHREPSEHITIKNCTIKDIRVVAYGGHPGNRRVYIGDNRFQGRQKKIVGSWGDFTSAAAVGLSGRGHVICHNTCHDFFDFFNNWGFFTGGRAGRVEPSDNSAVDVYGNYAARTGDNFAGMFPGINLRCMRNFVINHGDPALDTRNRVGPIYYIRNVVYNQRAGRAFKTDGTIHGLYAFHNLITCYPENYEGYFRTRVMNNLFLGAPAPPKRGRPRRPHVQVTTDRGNVLDHNGYFLPDVDDARPIFGYEDKTFDRLDALTAAAGVEAHGVTVDFESFRSAINPHPLPPAMPHSVPIIDAGKLDLRLREGSAAVDAGAAIPNVNEDFTGKAPDLGPYELGKPLPVYGSRMEPTVPKVLIEGDSVELSKLPEPLEGKPVARVNCGAALTYKAPDNAAWSPDRPYEQGKSWGHLGDGGRVVRNEAVAGTALQQLYLRERYGMDAYRFDLPEGRYVVRLHFAEGWVKGPGQRVFDVKINGKTVLDDFDIFEQAGGQRRAIHRDIAVDVGGKGLTISFEKIEDNPSINGIEIHRR
jgi:hypothetical protein